jgi:hypothetical protein
MRDIAQNAETRGAKWLANLLQMVRVAKYNKA